MKHPRYVIADAEHARQYRAAEFAQDFERPPSADPSSRDKLMSFNMQGTIESARALARAFGPLLCASDDPNDATARLAAQANHVTLAPGWCQCQDPSGPETREAYYLDQATGAHGWMCCTCRKTTQTG